MAKINDNLLVKGARGNVGKQYVYKKRGNDTHITCMPKVDKDAVPSAQQEHVRDLFAEASLYAKGAISSPSLKKEYQKKAGPGATAFNVAFRDFLKSPVVKSINTEKYDGTIGSIIVVKAKDDFRVVEVKISIYTADGVLVEQGSAILNPIDRNKWIYTATQLNANMNRGIIRAVALDLPGNKGSLEIAL